MKKIVSVVMLTTLVAGCQTIDPYTRQNKQSNTEGGVAVGAVAGAVLGAVVSSKKDRGRGLLTGALIGAAVGGGIGQYMDQQETLLRQELEGSGVSVAREGDQIRLVMPSNITFAVNKDEISSQFYPVLDSVAKVLIKYDQTLVVVDGFTDSTGSFEHNQQLSERRAARVSEYLTSSGLRYERLQTHGYGERYPVADNGTEVGRGLNRRVEINIRPIEKENG